MMIVMMTEHSSTCTAYENMLCFFYDWNNFNFKMNH
nr:MAG TPA: hypothetical protein [Caudoviricetes sp.]